MTSNEFFVLPDMPQRIVIAGGGYIAVELASILHGFGAQVTQLYRGELFLRGFDMDIRTTLAEEMIKKKLDLRFEAKVAGIEKNGETLTVNLKDGGAIEADAVLYATGRAPNSSGFGLEELGIERRGNGAIVVNDYFQTSVENIYALGDVTDRVQLTPVAIAEAMVLAGNLYKGENQILDYADIPTAVFSNPNIGTVGLSEEDARARHGAVDIYRETFRPLKHTLTSSEERTMMKMIVDRATDRVLGCHMVGPDAGELIQGLGIALKCNATKAQFDATVGIHPTAAEEFVTMRTKQPEPEA
jgi:glutathione reductase (NADPH)